MNLPWDALLLLCNFPCTVDKGEAAKSNNSKAFAENLEFSLTQREENQTFFPKQNKSSLHLYAVQHLTMSE
jgi:hypothetical protein